MFGNFNPDEIYEATETMLAIGVVKSVDYQNWNAVVTIAGVDSPPIEWLAPAGNLKIFAPPAIGEQVLVASINGDIAQGVILGGIFSNANAAPAAEQKLKLDYFGTIFEIMPNGEATITAPKITINSDIILNGKIDATGIITSSDDVIGGGKSLKTHKHTGVQTGGSLSGLPQ